MQCLRSSKKIIQNFYKTIEVMDNSKDSQKFIEGTKP